jgi:hypothetical protein
LIYHLTFEKKKLKRAAEKFPDPMKSQEKQAFVLETPASE